MGYNFIRRLAPPLAAVALLLLALLPLHRAQAADIAITGDTILFTGEIKAGDLSDLTKQVFKELAARPRGLTLSLNSNGSNFEEAILLSLFVKSSGIRTLVKSGNRCNSACALVFLGGTSIEGGEAGTVKDRNLEVGAELGFHMPYLAASQSSDNVTGEALTETQAIVQLTRLFNALDVPPAIRPLLMYQDAQHGLFDATTVEAVELLEINVEGLSVLPQKITRSMATNSCLNGYRLAQKQLPSLTAAGDTTNLSRAIGISPITVPQEANGEFLLLQSDFAGNGNMLVCRIGTQGECEGFYDRSALATQTMGQEQISELSNCQRESNVPIFVPATTRLSDVENQMRRMEREEPALLAPGTGMPAIGGTATPVPGAEEDAAAGGEIIDEDHAEPVPDIPDSPEPQQVTQQPVSGIAPFVVVKVPQRDEVICNANQSFANVRSGPNGKQYPIVSTLPNQTSVTVTGNTKNPESNHPWYEISFASGSGFIDSELVQNSCLVASAPTQPPAQIKIREAVVCNRKPGGDSANIRSAPNPNASTILRKVFNNEPIAIIGEANNPESGQLYFKVNADGVIGYVDNELVNTTCAVVTAPVAPAPGPSSSNAYICNAKSAVTNMRSGPNPENFPVVQELSNNDVVQVLGRTTNPASGFPWLRIAVNGTEGFVDASSVASSCNLTPASFRPTARVGQVICNDRADFTNMRMGPNKDMYDVVRKLYNNEPVTILESTTNPVSQQPWYKIEAAGEIGFVDSDYVRDGC